MNHTAAYQRWCAHPAVSPALKQSLAAMEGHEGAIRTCFSGSLSFGTAGLRGVMRPGTNSMNVHTVMQATAGLASYVISHGGRERGVAIAYDSRNHSAEFAKAAACVLAAMEVKAYLFDGMRPTPVLSFAIRHLGCIAGINITASHNPKEYNGYKAYYEDGAQLGPAQAKAVSDVIATVDVLDGVKAADYDEAVRDGRIVLIGHDVDEAYFACVIEQAVNPALFARGADMKFVYTPLHGTGRDFVPEVLRRVGMTHVLTVKEQMEPDGNFPTVAFPNPEFPEVFAPGIALAKENECDLIIATDPDADRVGIMALGKDGAFHTLTGNQTGALLLDYIISALKAQNRFPADAYAVKSIVTTALAARICRAEGVEMFDVLTGFKFIGEVIKNHEAMGKGTFLLGFEESYGYLKGTYARDKDAVVASLLIAEMALYYREKGMTLIDAMDALYARYGYATERVVSLTMQGADGAERMKALMKRLRATPPKALAGAPVTALRDYLTGEITHADGRKEATGLPASDVLYYVTAEQSTLVVRPSGTEPKIKFYVMTFGDDRAQADARAEALCEEAKHLANA